MDHVWQCPAIGSGQTVAQSTSRRHAPRPSAPRGGGARGGGGSLRGPKWPTFKLCPKGGRGTQGCSHKPQASPECTRLRYGSHVARQSQPAFFHQMFTKVVSLDRAWRAKLRTVLFLKGYEVVTEQSPHLCSWINEGHTFASIRRTERVPRDEERPKNAQHI